MLQGIVEETDKGLNNLGTAITDELEDVDAGEEDWFEEQIDFRDMNFILQNLEMAVPSYEEDESFTLLGRKHIADSISHQIAFYCYCALQVYIQSRDKLPLILVYGGDGFIGSQIINHLAQFELTKLLRIYVRSDVSAKDFKHKGFKANTSLLNLLDGDKPEVVILCTENSTFSTVCQQLAFSMILQQNTFIISTSFGFQRKKLFNNLKVHSIFRTFVEPFHVVSDLKMKFFDNIVKAAENIKNELVDDDSESFVESLGSEEKDIIAVLQAQLQHEADNNNDNNLLSKWDTTDLNEYEKCAITIIRRSIDIKNFLYLLENYYFLNNLSYCESRKLALKTIFGFTEEMAINNNNNNSNDNNNDNNSVNSNNTSNFDEESNHDIYINNGIQHDDHNKIKNNNKIKKFKGLELLLENMKKRRLFEFQNIFSKFITIEELSELLFEFPIEIDTKLLFKNKKYHVPIPEDTNIPRHRRVVKREPMYAEKYLLNNILSCDDDHSNYSGPGFEYMDIIDKKYVLPPII